MEPGSDSVGLNRICPDCGEPAPADYKFCRGCGGELPAIHDAEALTSPVSVSVQADFSLDQKKTPFWVYGMIGFVVLGFLAAIAVPNFGHRERRPSSKKACVSNMKTIEGAVELYLMEKNVGLGVSVDLKLLLREGYLKTEPQCPKGGHYSIRIASAAGGSAGSTVISCTVHRTIDDTTSGL